jgi:hypothetical protein
VRQPAPGTVHPVPSDRRASAAGSTTVRPARGRCSAPSPRPTILHGVGGVLGSASAW